jgi:hypothetical protein
MIYTCIATVLFEHHKMTDNVYYVKLIRALFSLEFEAL